METKVTELESHLLDVVGDMRVLLAKGSFELKNICYLDGARLIECELHDYELNRQFILEIREK